MSLGISVVVPVYNVENYLVRCVNSILKQKGVPFEIILVDDGSTDNSGKICDEFADQYDNIYVIHQENGGLSSARNTGLKKANYQYLFFVDSDDEIENNVFETVVFEMEKEHLDVIGFSGRVIYPNREEDLKHNIADSQYGKLLYGLDFLQEHTPLSIVPLYMYRLDFLTQNNITFWEGIFYEDMDFSVQIFLKNPRIKFIKKKCYIYYKRSNSITGSVNLKKYKDMCGIYQKYSSITNSKISEQRISLQKLLISYLMVTEELYHQLTGSEKKGATIIRKKLLIHIHKQHICEIKLFLVSMFPTICYHVRNIRRKITRN